jgi:hypothetical protein
VTYQVHTEPGGSVPSMIANKFVVDAPFNTLKALKERAEVIFRAEQRPDRSGRFVLSLYCVSRYALHEIFTKRS